MSFWDLILGPKKKKNGIGGKKAIGGAVKTAGADNAPLDDSSMPGLGADDALHSG
jgi:hypothetical protein